jgi:lysozyme family protein
MKQLNFDVCFDRLLKPTHEGEAYVNDPNDPGGETKYGISKRSYPRIDIKSLTRDDAKEIYRNDFWIPLRGLPDSVLFQLFDFAVNSGIGNAIRGIQRAINVADDGHWGPYSQSQAALISESDLLMRVIAERMRFMVKLKNFKHHGGGWMNRMAANLIYAAEDNEV